MGNGCGAEETCNLVQGIGTNPFLIPIKFIIILISGCLFSTLRIDSCGKTCVIQCTNVMPIHLEIKQRQT